MMSTPKAQWEQDFLVCMIHPIIYQWYDIPKITYFTQKTYYMGFTELSQKNFLKQYSITCLGPLCKVPTYVYKYLIQLQSCQMLPMLPRVPGICFTSHMLLKDKNPWEKFTWDDIHIYQTLGEELPFLPFITMRNFLYRNFIFCMCVYVSDIRNTTASLHLPLHYSNMYIRKDSSNTRVQSIKSVLRLQ